jgi:hypothetical protein
MVCLSGRIYELTFILFENAVFNLRMTVDGKCLPRVHVNQRQQIDGIVAFRCISQRLATKRRSFSDAQLEMTQVID